MRGLVIGALLLGLVACLTGCAQCDEGPGPVEEWGFCFPLTVVEGVALVPVLVVVLVADPNGHELNASPESDADGGAPASLDAGMPEAGPPAGPDLAP